jgi:hypothetical protein
VKRPIHGQLVMAGFSLQLCAGETMLRLTSRQRAMLIEKVPDVANLIFASTFLGQFLSDRPFSLVLGFAGLGAWTLLAIVAFMLAGDD